MKKYDDRKTLAKNSVIYFIGSTLSSIVKFLLLPVYTKYIVPADYGYYDIVNTYTSLLVSILYMEIWSTTLRFMLNKSEEQIKDKVVFNALIVFVCSTMLIILLFTIVNQVIPIQFAVYVLLQGIMTGTSTLFGYLARGENQNKLFALSGVVATIVLILLNILLLVFFSMGYEALYISFIASTLIQCLILNSRINISDYLKKIYFDKELIKDMLKFSLPYSLNTAMFWMLNSYSKIVVASYDITVSGYLSAAYKFSLVIVTIASCFNMAWQETAFAKQITNKNDIYYQTMINMFVKYLSFAFVILLPIVYFAFPILVDEKYSASKSLVPPYMLATILNSFSSFLTAIFAALGKTGKLFISTIVGAVVNVICIHLLLPVVGGLAATLSLIMGFGLSVIVRIMMLKKQIVIKIELQYPLVIIILLGLIATLFYYNAGVAINMVFLVVVLISGSLIFRKDISETIAWFRARIK